MSLIGLGTTSIGYLYGIGKRTLPSEREAIDFLKRVVDLGINFIDTARMYGLAEERIGKSEIAKIKGVVIATKCGEFINRVKEIVSKELRKKIRSEVEESLRKLKLEQIPLLQVHGGSAEQIKEGGIIEIMAELKDEGRAKFVGVSTSGEETPMAAIESGFFDTLQLAHSILDQRMAGKVFTEAKKRNLGIINRSVLLKGALTEAASHLPPSLRQLKANSDKASKVASDIGTDLPSLAIRFAISNEAVDTVLIGSNKIKNIEAAIRASEAGPLPTDVLNRLQNLAITDVSQIDPRNWPANLTVDAKNLKSLHP